jgi:magnesium chelatase family protein
MFVRVASAAVIGIEAAPIDVEVDVGVGLPCCNIVGLPDAGIREGRLRIRGALDNSGFKLPPRRTTVNLAPADLRKDGAAFDVPIAAGMLAAAGAVDARRSTARCWSASWRSTAPGGRCAACMPIAAWRADAACAAGRPRPTTRRGGDRRRRRRAAPPNLAALCALRGEEGTRRHPRPRRRRDRVPRWQRRLDLADVAGRSATAGR